MLQLAKIVAREKKKKYDVLYIDFEAQYKYTIEHINELKKQSHIRKFYHFALPLSLRNSVSVLQPKWICWDDNSKDLWVRNMPDDSINIYNNPVPDFKFGEEFEDNIKEDLEKDTMNIKDKRKLEKD